MTAFTGNTTRQPENLSMRQPTSLDGSTAGRGHWCATTGSTIGKPALTSNGRHTRPFESRYVKNDKVRETGAWI